MFGGKLNRFQFKIGADSSGTRNSIAILFATNRTPICTQIRIRFGAHPFIPYDTKRRLFLIGHDLIFRETFISPCYRLKCTKLETIYFLPSYSGKVIFALSYDDLNGKLYGKS
jgi:hypothetical protein